MEGVGRASIEPGSSESFLPLRRALGVTSFGINQMKLRPGQRWRIHRHLEQEEVYLVLEGELTVSIEGDEFTVREGELARIAPELRRQILNRSPEPVLLIALGGSGEHQSRDAEAFHSWEDETPSQPRDVPLPEDLEL